LNTPFVTQHASLRLSASLLQAILVNGLAYNEAKRAAKGAETTLKDKLEAVELIKEKLEIELRRYALIFLLGLPGLNDFSLSRQVSDLRALHLCSIVLISLTLAEGIWRESARGPTSQDRDEQAQKINKCSHSYNSWINWRP
jgi:hypothetical protein